MNLTEEDKQIICNLLSQVSLPVSQATRVLQIIQKLQLPPVTGKEEKK